MTRQMLRFIAGITLVLVMAPASASKDVRVFLRHHTVPEHCQPLGEVTAKAGGRWTGTFRSDRYIRKSVAKRLHRMARQRGADAVHFQDRREFNSRGSTLGLERIEQDAILLDCSSASR